MIASQGATTSMRRHAFFVERGGTSTRRGGQVPASLPPPFYSTFVAFIGALLAREVGQDLRGPLQELATQLADDSELIALHVGGCKLIKVANEENITICVACNTLPQREVVVKAVHRLGLRHHTGQPPAGWLEEELGEWLDHLRTIQT